MFSVFSYNLGTCANNRNKCSQFADCKDYSSGYCCHCRPGFYGNGIQCVADGDHALLFFVSVLETGLKLIKSVLCTKNTSMIMTMQTPKSIASLQKLSKTQFFSNLAMFANFWDLACFSL